MDPVEPSPPSIQFQNELTKLAEDFYTDVILHFKRSDRPRGQDAFERWQGRLLALLQKWLPEECDRYRKALTRGPFRAKLLTVSEYTHFMTNAGDKALAFIEGLLEEAVLGRLNDRLSLPPEAEHTPETAPLSLASPDAITQSPPDSRMVFVIHGRDHRLRDAMFDFLRCIDLHPIEWSEAVDLTGKGTPYIGEILDTAFARAQAVVVLLTPDDLARLNSAFLVENDPDYERIPTGQARPNVLFEAGMAFGRNSDRTILVEIGKLRPFSDIGGRHALRLSNDTRKRQDLAQRLTNAGCNVSLIGTDWHTAGDFTPLQHAPESEPPTADSQPTLTVPDLSNEAIRLLLEAAQDPDGRILRVTTAAGLTVQTNGKNLVESPDARSEALWERAIEELRHNGLISSQSLKGGVFRLTADGYELADRLPRGM